LAQGRLVEYAVSTRRDDLSRHPYIDVFPDEANVLMHVRATLSSEHSTARSAVSRAAAADAANRVCAAAAIFPGRRR